MIHFGEDDHRFLLRAAAVAIEDGRVLLQRIGDHDFWCLPGGRIEIGEDSVEGLRREVLEECGIPAEIGRLIWVIENFYPFRGTREHEMGLYFEAKFPAGSPVFRDEWSSEELDGTPLLFRWHEVSDLEQIPLKPSLLQSLLADPPASTTHLVHRDE
jgi:8-oxo-dGTP pyrophosphatase MutT (NUDIX family)